MKSLLVGMCQLLLLAVVAMFLGWKVWFSVWMYHSWPGPPGVLAKLLGADGERAYDAIADEMGIICFLVLLGLWVGARIMIRHRAQNRM